MQNDSPDNHVIVLTYGPDFEKIVSKNEINHLPVTVVNCRYFKPIDEQMLTEIASRNAHVIIYETDMLEGGLGASVLEFCNDHQLNMQVHRIGIQDHYVQHGSINLLRKEEGIDLNTLYNEIIQYI